MALISGDGMAGANGQRYQIDDQGFIDESHYALKQGPAVHGWPLWSPDGTRLVFESGRSGNLDIWVI